MYEQWRRVTKEMGDAMSSLENRTLVIKREMDIRSPPDEMNFMEAKQATVSVGAMLEALQRSTPVEQEDKLEKDNENLIKPIFQGSKEVVCRIDVDELDDDETTLTSFGSSESSQLNAKERNVSQKVSDSPTEYLTTVDGLTKRDHKRGDWNVGANQMQPECFPERQTDFVLEAQPLQSHQPDQLEPKKRKHRKKENPHKGVLRKNTRWTMPEMVALASAWVDVSEDTRTANFQKNCDFWSRVRTKFYNAIGTEFRTADMISGKWTEIRRNAGKFDDIYNRVSNNRENGWDELTIFNRACDEYREEVKKPFTEQPVWDVLRKSSKWAEVLLTGQSSKRAKTCSSGDYVSSSGTQVSDAHTIPQESVLPPGMNNRSKRPQGSTSTSVSMGAIDGLRESIDKLCTMYREFVDLQKEKLDVQKEKQRQKDMEFLEKSFDHLPPVRRQAMEKMQEQIIHKYGLD